MTKQGYRRESTQIKAAPKLRIASMASKSMRRVKDSPIPEQVQALILDAAVRAPSGGNAQNWRFLLVDDREVKARVAEIYRECITQLWEHFYKDRIEASSAARGSRQRAVPPDREVCRLCRRPLEGPG